MLAAADASAGDGRARLIARIDSLNRRALAMYESDAMLAPAREAYDLSRKIRYKRGEGWALKCFAVREHTRSNFDSALLLYHRIYALFDSLQDKPGMADALLGIATVLNNRNDHAESIVYSTRSLRMHEALKDRKGIGKALNLLGVSWAVQGMYAEARDYFFQYNELIRQGTDSVDLGYSYNNIGCVYRDMRQLDSASLYFDTASEVFTRVNNRFGMALAYQNLGSVCYDQQRYPAALMYAQRSLELHRELASRRSMTHNYHDIASVLLRQHDTLRARRYFDSAVRLASEIGEKIIMRNSSHELAMIHERSGNYKAALAYYRTANLYQDSMFSLEKTRMYGDLEKKYQTEKKERQIALLRQDAALHRLRLRQRNLLLAATIMLLSSAALTVYFVQNRRKLRTEVRLQAELHRQQQRLTQDVLQAEERERRRIAADLHDGVGQMLSAVQLSLHRVREQTREDSELRRMTEHTAALLSRSCDEMRAISHQMMPGALLKSGLAQSVREFVEQLDSSSFRVYLDVSGLQVRLDEQTETILYRVIQESVNNVIRHAAATELSIQIAQDEQGISVTVEDNGTGFDPAASGHTEGIGLKNIRSRIALLQGVLEIDTFPGKGTLLAVFIPAAGITT